MNALPSGSRPADSLLPSLRFRPLPLLGNAHLQTLLGNLLPGPRLVAPTWERRVALPDGDRLVLHDSVPATWQPGDPVVLLIHGLGGSARSAHLLRMARRLLPQGLRVVRMNMRGSGRGTALARRAYHGGCSGDVRAALAALHHDSPASPLTLVGFSLGGNIALKLAGEAATDPVPGLARVATLAPPIDVERCAALLASPQNRFYDRHFVRSLVRQVSRRQQLFPELESLRFPRELTLRQFDDLHTAPCWGFADAIDYYRRVSSRPLLGRITLPTLILTARDDPFIAVESYEGLTLPSSIELHILEHGGHLGFLGWDGAGGVRWAERRLVEWIVAGLSTH